MSTEAIREAIRNVIAIPSFEEDKLIEALSKTTTPGLRETVREQFEALYEVHSILEVTDRSLNTFSGDEDSLQIVEELSIVCRALRVAKRLILETQETLEIAASRDEEQSEVTGLGQGGARP